MKLVIIGAGSSYTPELVQGVIEHCPEIPFTQVCLMDVDERRLDILTGLTRRMLTKADLSVEVAATTERRRALALEREIAKVLRPPTMKERLRQVAILALAMRWKLRCRLVGDVVQPSTIVTRFNNNGAGS